MIHGDEKQDDLKQKQMQNTETTKDDRTEKEEGKIVEEDPDKPGKGKPAAYKA